MVHTIKPTNLCVKHNPKSLQKQHGYKTQQAQKKKKKKKLNEHIT